MATPEQKYHERVAKIRAKHPLPDKALVAPGYGGWAAYFDGVIIAKTTPGFKPEAVLLQDIANLELQSPRGPINGSLKITAGAPGGGTRVVNLNFLKDEEPVFVHFRDVLTTENQRGVRGVLPPEYQVKFKDKVVKRPTIAAPPPPPPPKNVAPFMGIPDEKFRAKYKIPADAVLARSAGAGYISFDGHFVTIQHIGINRMTIGKNTKRFPVTAISNIQLKPAGWVMPGHLQITAGGSNEAKSRFGLQTWDALFDENSIDFSTEEQPAFLALRDAIEQAQRNLHAPRQTAPAAPPREDVMAQLEKLGSLRDAGILTEEEFTAKKAELLRRL